MKFLAILPFIGASYALPSASRSPAESAASASATPSSSTAPSASPSAFTLNIRWSNSPLKGPLNANGGAFFTGKKTASYCPENIPGCPTVDTTSFVTDGSGKLFLNAGVPGGQQVYVNPQGKLTYTVPHSAYIPTGSLTDLVSVSADGFLNPFLTYWLCNSEADQDAWSVWLEYTNGTTGSITNNGSDGKNACTRIALEKEAYAGSEAWEFT